MPGSLRLPRLGFRAGPRPDTPALELEPSSVVVLVGPNNAGSVGLQRFGKGERYRSDTFMTTLASVAEKTKSLPAEFINEAGNNINDSFIEYVSPLVGPLPEVGFIPR